MEALTFEITDEDCFGDPFYVIKFNFGTMYENKVKLSEQEFDALIESYNTIKLAKFAREEQDD